MPPPAGGVQRYRPCAACQKTTHAHPADPLIAYLHGYRVQLSGGLIYFSNHTRVTKRLVIPEEYQLTREELFGFFCELAQFGSTYLDRLTYCTHFAWNPTKTGLP